MHTLETQLPELLLVNHVRGKNLPELAQPAEKHEAWNRLTAAVYLVNPVSTSEDRAQPLLVSKASLLHENLISCNFTLVGIL